MGNYGEPPEYLKTQEPVIGQPAFYQHVPYGQPGANNGGPQGYPSYAAHQEGYLSGMQAPPLYAQIPSQQTAEWSTRLCSCCSDCEVCCLTCWCPCIAFGRLSEVVDEGATSCSLNGAIYLLLLWAGIPCVYSFLWRTKLRVKYGLRGGSLGDLLRHVCCEPCSLCQEFRELKNRGLDPSVGWETLSRNFARPMAVPTAPVMMR